jgi:hypothetical protein
MCGLPNLLATMSGSLVNYRAAQFSVRIYNQGPVAATNVELLFQTNVPAGWQSLVTNGGFVCHSLVEYEPRLGVACTGGSIPRFDSVLLTFGINFYTSGVDVLSVNADPNNAIVELIENDNLANAAVNAP